MWRGSAAEYRHEKENERVCLDCGAKRKDPCREDGAVVDAHESRHQMGRAEREHKQLEDEAYRKMTTIMRMREEIRARWDTPAVPSSSASGDQK